MDGITIKLFLRDFSNSSIIHMFRLARDPSDLDKLWSSCNYMNLREKVRNEEKELSISQESDAP